jgi:hypothetical protein
VTRHWDQPERGVKENNNNLKGKGWKGIVQAV